MKFVLSKVLLKEWIMSFDNSDRFLKKGAPLEIPNFLSIHFFQNQLETNADFKKTVLFKLSEKS
jgi:hypothetical protein